MTPTSKGEIDQLGRRLRESAGLTETDRRALDEFRLRHRPALDTVREGSSRSASSRQLG